MIVRTEKKKGRFGIFDNDILQDNRLSAKAKYVLIYMLNKPADWQFTEREISENITDGIAGINSAIKELIKFGYVIRRQKREKGQIKGYDYIIYEKAQNSVDVVPDEFNFNILERQLRAEGEKMRFNTNYITTVIDVTRYFIEARSESKYVQTQHPVMTNEQVKKLLCSFYKSESGVFDFSNLIADYGKENAKIFYKNCIDFYLSQNLKGCNYSILHFMSGEIRDICFYKKEL